MKNNVLLKTFYKAFSVYLFDNHLQFSIFCKKDLYLSIGKITFPTKRIQTIKLEKYKSTKTGHFYKILCPIAADCYTFDIDAINIVNNEKHNNTLVFLPIKAIALHEKNKPIQVFSF